MAIRGRPPYKWSHRIPDLVRLYDFRTVKDLAEFLGVSRKCVYAWGRKYKEFDEVLEVIINERDN
jgi:predicted transcriptional regulator